MHIVAVVIHELGGLGGAGAFVASLAAWRSARQAAGPGDLAPLSARLDVIDTGLSEIRRHLDRQVDHLQDVDHMQECELRDHEKRLDRHDSRLLKIETRKI